MNLQNFFKDLNDSLFVKEMELAAIWMEKPVVTETERTVRLTEGHKIRVEDGKIVDCEPGKPATHKILGCFGTVSSSSLGFTLMDINSNEPLTLKVR
jgi:hypothetical protein